MKTLSDFSFAGERAVIRVDFNVPLNEKFEITDDTRLRAALPTLRHILNDGGSIVILSHLGRPKNGPEERFSLRHVVEYLKEALNVPVQFATDCVGEVAQAAREKLQAGEVLVLENLRFHAEEKKGDRTFAEQLAAHGTVYVNDAFGTAHRAHASTAVMAEFFPTERRLAGYVMQQELENAEKVLQAPERPLVAIMGGAKISDKILIIERLMERVDKLLIGGGMAYTFFKAQGGKIGNSLVEEERLGLAHEILQKAEAKNVEILLPEDSVVADKFDAAANTQVVPSNAIPEGWMGLDIGPKAIEKYKAALLSAKIILWNGPMGVFEMEAFSKGTFGVAEAIAEATEKGAFSLIGGGDSAAAVAQLGFRERVSYISTGGGALLEYFEGKTLPGVAALKG